MQAERMVVGWRAGVIEWALRRARFALLVGAAALPVLATAPALAETGGDAAAGKQLAELHCSRCHAIGNTDKSLMEGAPPFRDLKLRYPIEDLAEALAEGIMTSHPQMPVFTFTPEQIDDLLAYLGSLE